MIEYQSPAAEETLNEGFPSPHASPASHMAPIDSGQPPLIEVRHLKWYDSASRSLSASRSFTRDAVEDISFTIRRGETLGIVGEAGSGKTALARTVLRLYEPADGEILYNGKPLQTKKDLREYRKKAAIIFQNPRAALNPRMTAADIIGEPLDIHRLYAGQAREKRILDLMEKAGLDGGYAGWYPRGLTDGQCRRVDMARALALNPDFLVCDEPVWGLDVSDRARVLNLLDEVRNQMGLLFLTRDAAAARHISTRMGILYRGRLVELADAGELWGRPLHPFTKALRSAVPQPDPHRPARTDGKTILTGVVPRGSDSRPDGGGLDNGGPDGVVLNGNPSRGGGPSLSGCPYRARCPHAMELCGRSVPEYREVSTGHFCACHRVERERAIP